LQQPQPSSHTPQAQVELAETDSAVNEQEPRAAQHASPSAAQQALSPLAQQLSLPDAQQLSPADAQHALPSVAQQAAVFATVEQVVAAPTQPSSPHSHVANTHSESSQHSQPTSQALQHTPAVSVVVSALKVTADVAPIAARMGSAMYAPVINRNILFLPQ
jgi:hypothetical protein